MEKADLKWCVRLFVDPGHGMGNRETGVFDPGAVSNGVREADVALAFGLAVKFYAEKVGLPVVMSRADNVTPAPLATRVRHARLTDCSHILSIHCNESDSAGAHGTESFYPGVFAHRECELFAAGIHPKIVRALGTADRGTKPETLTARKKLAIMRYGDDPTEGGFVCLTELAFLSNPADATRVLQRASRIAFAVAVVDYFAELCGIDPNALPLV